MSATDNAARVRFHVSQELVLVIALITAALPDARAAKGPRAR